MMILFLPLMDDVDGMHIYSHICIWKINFLQGNDFIYKEPQNIAKVIYQIPNYKSTNYHNFHVQHSTRTPIPSNTDIHNS